jgi:hypothetical protein
MAENGTRGSKSLPRVPHADKVRADETILKKNGADLQNGWLGRHGDLIITEDRLVFQPTILDTLLRAKRREIRLDDIQEIEHSPLSPDDMPPGGRRPRVMVHTDACVYEFMVGDLDLWMDTMERVYQRRRKAGKPWTPRFTREGYVNLLLDSDGE